MIFLTTGAVLEDVLEDAIAQVAEEAAPYRARCRHAAGSASAALATATRQVLLPPPGVVVRPEPLEAMKHRFEIERACVLTQHRRQVPPDGDLQVPQPLPVQGEPGALLCEGCEADLRQLPVDEAYKRRRGEVGPRIHQSLEI